MEFKFLHYLWADIRQGRNVEVYFTVLLCLVVVILNMFGIIDLKLVTSAILAVLSLESYSLLTNRHTEQELKQSLDLVLERQSKPRLTDIFVPFGEDMQERARHFMHADEVWILSRTCRRLWNDYEDELRTIAERGGLKLMICDPNDGAMDMITKSAIWQQPGDGDRLKAEVQLFITRMAHIQKTLHLNKFEVRLIDYLPAWTLILINPRKNNGLIYVELATYRSHPRKRPSFTVQCGLDNDLYDQFRYEFEQMWNNAKPAWAGSTPRLQ